MKKYSVLMTVYINDLPDHFMLAINSIILQTIKPFEIVLVGDGPLRKEVLDIIYLLISQNLGIKFIELERNVGLGMALDIGLQNVSTNIVMRMDSDDYSLPNRAEILLQHLIDDVKVVGSYIGEFGCNFDCITSIIKYRSSINFSDLNSYYRDPVGHASTMFYKDCILSAGGYKHCLLFEDTYLWLRLAKSHSGRFVNVPGILYHARTGNGFYVRRSGLDYLLLEISSFTKFYNEKLITRTSYLINVIIRPFCRLLPKLLLTHIYKNFLRSRH